MKRTLRLLAFGIVFMAFSTMLHAEAFNGGGYLGPSLEPITIADLADAAPNQFVIVSGILVQQRMPGRFVFVDESDDQSSVMVRIGAFEWSNLEVDGETPVLVYGIVLKSESSIEILAERIAFPDGQ